MLRGPHPRICQCENFGTVAEALGPWALGSMCLGSFAWIRGALGTMIAWIVYKGPCIWGSPELYNMESWLLYLFLVGTLSGPMASGVLVLPRRVPCPDFLAKVLRSLSQSYSG